MNSLFVDIPNIFYNCKKKHNAKVDFEKLYRLVQERNGMIFKSFAYGFQIEEEAVPFITCLHHIGFETKWFKLQKGVDTYRRFDLCATIGMDVVRINPKVLKITLVTNDIGIVPVIEWAKDQGNFVEVIGCRLGAEIKNASSRYLEIPTDVLAEVVNDSETIL